MGCAQPAAVSRACRYVNFLGGSPLNRLSWLRTSHPFLNTVTLSPAARWVAFQSGYPLIHAPSKSESNLAYLSTADVRPLLGAEPFFGQGQHDGESAASDVHVLEAARFRGAPVVFLGLHEPQQNEAVALPSEDLSKHADPTIAAQKLKGIPYFSIDVTDLAQSDVDKLTQAPDVSFSEPRAAIRGMNAFDAGVFAAARTMADWNARNKVHTAHFRPRLLCPIRLRRCSSALRAGLRITLFGRDGSYRARRSSRGLTIQGESPVPQRA